MADIRDPKFPEDSSRFLEVKASYGKGGMNLFTYKTDPRGYSLYIQPVKLERRDLGDLGGYTSRQYSLFGPPQEAGLRFFIEATGRLSRKRLDALSAAVAARASEIAAWFRAEDYDAIRRFTASLAQPKVAAGVAAL